MVDSQSFVFFADPENNSDNNVIRDTQQAAFEAVQLNWPLIVGAGMLKRGAVGRRQLANDLCRRSPNLRVGRNIPRDHGASGYHALRPHRHTTQDHGPGADPTLLSNDYRVGVGYFDQNIGPNGAIGADGHARFVRHTNPETPVDMTACANMNLVQVAVRSPVHWP